jgi:hypothetical protein
VADRKNPDAQHICTQGIHAQGQVVSRYLDAVCGVRRSRE